MAYAGHQNDHALGVNEYSDEKVTADHVSLDHVATTRRKREAPPLVRDLTPEDRQRLEKILIRKIDIRLMPMIILMYVLNYLDRNNIASARLAGLEDDLNLTSTQFNVCYHLMHLYKAQAEYNRHALASSSLAIYSCRVRLVSRY